MDTSRDVLRHSSSGQSAKASGKLLRNVTKKLSTFRDDLQQCSAEKEQLQNAFELLEAERQSTLRSCDAVQLEVDAVLKDSSGVSRELTTVTEANTLLTNEIRQLREDINAQIQRRKSLQRSIAGEKERAAAQHGSQSMISDIQGRALSRLQVVEKRKHAYLEDVKRLQSELAHARACKEQHVRDAELIRVSIEENLHK